VIGIRMPRRFQTFSEEGAGLSDKRFALAVGWKGEE
jgi:hypothetical protein